MRLKVNKCFLALVVILSLSVSTFATDFEESDFETEPIFDEHYYIDEEFLNSALEAQTDIISEMFAEMDAHTDDIPSYVDSTIRSFEADTSLGHLEFYLPAGTPSNPFIQSGQYYLNGTSSTLYLYCPRYPSYTFSASRFSNFQYRNTGTTYFDLQLHNVSGLGVSDVGSGVLDYLPNICLIIISLGVVALVTHQKQSV